MDENNKTVRVNSDSSFNNEPKYLIKHKNSNVTGIMNLRQIKIFKDKIIVLRQLKEKPEVITK